MAFINFNNPLAGLNDLLNSTNDLFDVINGFAGIDTVSYGAATSAVNVDLFITGFQLTGGSRFDRLVSIENLVGSTYNDTLSGDAGNNELDGAGGINTVSYARSTGGVRVNLSLTAAQNTLGAGFDTLRNFQNITGSRFSDILTGTLGNNVIDGGDGYDTVSYINASSAVVVSLAISAAQATGGAGSDTLLNLEGLIGSEFSDRLTGNGRDNTIEGLTGNDSLFGTVGYDTFFGGSGTDTANYQSFRSPISFNVFGSFVEKWAFGLDKLVEMEIVVASSTVSDTIDHTTVAGPFTSTSTDLTGNTVLLNGPSPVSYGIQQFENVEGSNFTDKINGNQSSNILNGYKGDDFISGQAGDDVLTGGPGNDSLDGGSGNDFLEGGLGTDIISASAGSDIINYTSTAESVVGGARDVITGFTTGFGGDFLGLTEIDANTTVAEDQNFSAVIIVGAGPYTSIGQLRYQIFAGNLHLFGNTDSNLTTDEFEIQLNGLAAITTANIYL
ncbi:MAG: calcium-binding protein [Synechococcaceae cyanobacterium]|jgi:Ca2+-binding RTX toxin-like protein